MKTQMRLKTGERSLFKSEEYVMGKAENKNRPTVLARYGGCTALIAVLAISAYLGAQGHEIRSMPRAPVVSTIVDQGAYEDMSFNEIEKRIEDERKQELSLLESVIEDENAGQSAKDAAYSQKIEMAMRIGLEAQIKAAMAHMGFENTSVICLAEMATLIIPDQYAHNDADIARIIDAAASVGGYEAKDVKIILVKK